MRDGSARPTEATIVASGRVGSFSPAGPVSTVRVTRLACMFPWGVSADDFRAARRWYHAHGSAKESASPARLRCRLPERYPRDHTQAQANHCYQKLQIQIGDGRRVQDPPELPFAGRRLMTAGLYSG